MFLERISLLVWTLDGHLPACLPSVAATRMLRHMHAGMRTLLDHAAQAG